MASLSNAVTIIVVFAILIQFLVDRVKELVGDKVMNIVKAPVWAVAFGALFALMFDIDFFALMGYSSQLPIIAKVKGKQSGQLGGTQWERNVFV